jgi:hypothetical protein
MKRFKEYISEKTKLVKIAYHVVRDIPKGSAKFRINDILKNGFKIGKGDKGALGYNSISLFTEKRPAIMFGNFDNSRVLQVILPKNLKLLDRRDNKIIEDYDNWFEKNKINDKYESSENLKAYGGYHGVIDEANYGVEYRIHNIDMINKLKVTKL